MEATYSFAQGASARFRRYRKTSQSTSAARMISRTASVIPNTNAHVLNSSTVALLAVAKAAARAARRSGDKAKLKKILAARQIASALTAGWLKVDGGAATRHVCW